MTEPVTLSDDDREELEWKAKHMPESETGRFGRYVLYLESKVEHLEACLSDLHKQAAARRVE